MSNELLEQLNAFADRVHSNAVNKEWWEERDKLVGMAYIKWLENFPEPMIEKRLADLADHPERFSCAGRSGCVHIMPEC